MQKVLRIFIFFSSGNVQYFKLVYKLVYKHADEKTVARNRPNFRRKYVLMYSKVKRKKVSDFLNDRLAFQKCNHIILSKHMLIAVVCSHRQALFMHF